MIQMTRKDVKRLAMAMKGVLESPEDTPAKRVALGVVVLLMGPLPQPDERLCRLSARRLAKLPAEWTAKPPAAKQPEPR